MALTAVDLSLASKRITPTLSMDVIFGNLSQAVGSRAGVASVQTLKDLIGGGSATQSADRPRAAHQRADLLVGHEREP